jgi:hypothetical protein
VPISPNENQSYRIHNVSDTVELNKYYETGDAQSAIREFRSEQRSINVVAEQAPTPALDDEMRLSLYDWGSRLSAMLVRVRDRFDGDLDRYLIYMVFLLAQLSEAKALAQARSRGRPIRPLAARGLNALSISEITRIPRETTRRKLKALVRSGRLRRDADGLYHLVSTLGFEDVFPDPLFWPAASRR